ncbi:unnamed protein product [Lactuca virosa]|uniref:Uncharacterized protein n=1 Tax=Lactuca virosa TaxID=75947 RepID=A0AAU9PPD5_9ASTR|nr:unnamed protein product [Lactuca virosa]
MEVNGTMRRLGVHTVTEITKVLHFLTNKTTGKADLFGAHDGDPLAIHLPSFRLCRRSSRMGHRTETRQRLRRNRIQHSPQHKNHTFCPKNHSGDWAVQSWIYHWQLKHNFGVADVKELISILADSQGECSMMGAYKMDTYDSVCPPRVRAMLASRAYRSSVMIGDPLGRNEMKKTFT